MPAPFARVAVLPNCRWRCRLLIGRFIQIEFDLLIRLNSSAEWVKAKQIVRQQKQRLLAGFACVVCICSAVAAHSQNPPQNRLFVRIVQRAQPEITKVFVLNGTAN